MTGSKPTAATDRMGVYKRLADVPDRHRLRQYTDRYEGRDVWQRFVATRSDEFDSTHYHRTIEKTHRTWTDHMADRERHYALATPDDVEAWCADLAATRQLSTVYSEYWVRLEEFYTWLQFHTDHPHVYQPVLMAAATHETAQALWQTKIDTKANSGGETDD